MKFETLEGNAGEKVADFLPRYAEAYRERHVLAHSGGANTHPAGPVAEDALPWPEGSGAALQNTCTKNVNVSVLNLHQLASVLQCCADAFCPRHGVARVDGTAGTALTGVRHGRVARYGQYVLLGGT
eukprot:363283-Chlamydomonas_euryale.AAC.1